MLPESLILSNRKLANIIQPTNQVLAKITQLGVPLCIDLVFKKAREFWPNRIKRLKAELEKVAGYRFNINSGPQLQKFLYEKLGLLPVYNDQGKVTADQSALAQLHYDYGNCQKCKGQGCEACQKTGKTEYDRPLAIIREIRLLSHRANNFVLPFLDWNDCPKCSSSKSKVLKGECDACEGWGTGKFIGINKRVVTERNGWHYFHPVYLQTPNTFRLAAVDRCVHQFSRYEKRFNLRVRDIIAARPGWLLVKSDYKKGERWGAACIYDADSIKQELEDEEAFANLASVIFGLSKELCKKGSIWYDAAKVFCYAGQYYAQPFTVQKILLKMTGINMPLEQIALAMQKYWSLYEDYFDTIKEFAWKSYQRGWCKTLHGAKYSVAQPPILARFTDWRQIERHSVKSIREEARIAFNRIVRAVTSFEVQSSITGVPSQLIPLKYSDALDKMTQPEFWSLQRIKNGDSNIAHIVILQHDSIMTHCRSDWAERVLRLQEDVMCDFNNFEPFIDNHPSIRIPLKVSSEISRVWDDIPPNNWQELTQDKNPLDYWENEIHFTE